VENVFPFCKITCLTAKHRVRARKCFSCCQLEALGVTWNCNTRPLPNSSFSLFDRFCTDQITTFAPAVAYDFSSTSELRPFDTCFPVCRPPWVLSGGPELLIAAPPQWAQGEQLLRTTSTITDFPPGQEGARKLSETVRRQPVPFVRPSRRKITPRTGATLRKKPPAEFEARGAASGLGATLP